MRHFLTPVICLVPSVVLAQDPITSQPYAASMYLNPAFAGYEGCSRVALSYRNQWPAQSTDQHTLLLGYDQYIRPLRGSIGAYIMAFSSPGTLFTKSASFIYSTTFGLFSRKLLISPAIQVEWMVRNADTWSFYEQGWDPRTGGLIDMPADGEQYQERHSFNASAGFILAHHNLTYGLAIHNLAEPYISLSKASGRLPRSYTAHTAYLGKVHEKVRIIGALMFHHQMDFEFLYPNLTLNVWGARIGFGLRVWTQGLQNLVFQLGYSRKWFSIGYSYDHYVSTALKSNNIGAHEASLQFRFNCKNKERGLKGTSLWGM